VAVLGDMLELGEQAKKLHYELGEQAVQMGVNQIYVVGDFAKDIINGARSAGFKNGNAQHFASLEELQEVACHEIKSGDVFLIKGSRSMQMERVAEYLKLRIGTG
jgi:UDP-N-acetylmuramyl pentapeptide synthase